MIPDASTMDRLVPRHPWTRRTLPWLLAGIAFPGMGLVFLLPAVRRWTRAERVVDASRLRIAEVVKGDLDRDIAVQGRVVAALHPTLFSPAQGIVTLLVKPGAEVKKGDAPKETAYRTTP